MRSPALRAPFTWTPIDKSHAKALGLEGQVQELAPHQPKHVGMILNKSVWVEIPLTEQWLAAFRLVNKGGMPVVAELRVFPVDLGPNETKRPAGQWRGEYGSAEGVPRAGLTARQIHQVRLGTFKDVLRKVLARDGEALKSLAIDFPNLPQAIPQPVTRGRKGRPDMELATIAAVYATAYLANFPPIPAIAKRFRLSLSQARDAVFRARKRGFLSPAEKQGRAEGMLTPQARALLNQSKGKISIAQRMKRRTRHGTKR